MGKRFIETTIWTQNKWFRKLPSKIKLFWFYLLSHCDSVGVWEEDLELASFIIGEKLNEKELLESFGRRVKIFNGNKWWVKDFCYFQYGILKEDNIKNKPHQSYVSLLKKHSLWIDYIKGMKYPIQRDKEKDIYKDKEKEKEKDKINGEDEIQKLWISTWGKNPAIPERDETQKLLNKFGYDKTYKAMYQSKLDGFFKIKTLANSLDENGNIIPKDKNNEQTTRGAIDFDKYRREAATEKTGS